MHVILTPKIQILSGFREISFERPSGKKHSTGQKVPKQPIIRRNANRPSFITRAKTGLPAPRVPVRRLPEQPETGFRLRPTQSHAKILHRSSFITKRSVMINRTNSSRLLKSPFKILYSGFRDQILIIWWKKSCFKLRIKKTERL